VVRIASLTPSATEIAFALGLADDVIGVTFECDHPGDPRQGRSVLVGGLDTDGLTTAEIDGLVRARVAAGDDLYRLDEAAFRQVDPDVVLTQDLCRVCALAAGEVDAALDRLGCEAIVVTLDPHSLEEIFETIDAVGAATDRIEQAGTLVSTLRARLATLAEQVAGRKAPRVFVLEWPDPPFVAGHWVPEMVTAAGGSPILARPGQRSVTTTWAEIVAADPDVVVVASCGFDLDGTASHANDVLAHLSDRPAVWAVDANAVMVRPGPRVVSGVEMLAALFHHGAPDPKLARRIR
jgi:iron complex transport system substrate-binding protein